MLDRDGRVARQEQGGDRRSALARRPPGQPRRARAPAAPAHRHPRRRVRPGRARHSPPRRRPARARDGEAGRATRTRCCTCSSTRASCPASGSPTRSSATTRSSRSAPTSSATSGEIAPEQLKRLRKQGYELGDKIGQGGIEATYDRYLRGQPGRAAAARRLGRPAAQRHEHDPRARVAATRCGSRSTSSSSRLRSERCARRSSTRGRRTARAAGWRTAAQSSRSTRATARSARSRRTRPTSRACTPAGRTARELRPSRRSARGGGGELPGDQPRDAGSVPARLDLEAGHRARRDAGAHPGAVLDACRAPARTSPGRDRQEFRNWTPMNAAMTLPTALGASCDTYFYKVGEDFYDLPPERGQPLQAWASRLGFGKPTGIDVGPEEAGLRADDRVEARDAGPTTRSRSSGSRATRSSWRSGRRTCSSRRCRWPTFYALRRERRQAREAAPRQPGRGAGATRARSRSSAAASRRRRRGR